MKKFLLLTFLFTAFFSSKAQFVNYEHETGWNIGFNLGATWQSRELYSGPTSLENVTTRPFGGFGGGMTLGKSIYEKEGAFFALDWRGRYLGSYNSGWVGVPDSTSTYTGDTTGNSFGFRNYRMSLHEFSLEAVITLHRLRERTGIILYGFGGIGATFNKVKTEKFDRFDDLNNYSSSDLIGSPNDIANELGYDISNDFETTLTPGRFSLVPSLGFGLGKQFGESFSMGLEYKVAYDILGDEFDGGAQNYLEDNFMDRYHYAGVFFRWNILSGRTRYVPNNNTTNNNNWSTNQTTTTNTTTTHTTVQQIKPLVNIYHPSINNSVVHSSLYTIKAKIYHVNNSNGITFKQNGLIMTGFTYNPNSNEFSANVYLQPGSNQFEIIGSNQYGSDQDSRIIIYDMGTGFTTAPPPIVNFTNPALNSTNVTNPQYNVVATVLNVGSKNDITFTVNGVISNNFTFNANTKMLSALINLNEGNNNVTVKGVNQVGTDVKTVNIIYTKPQQQPTPIPPVVTIDVPSTNPYNTNSPVEIINGSVLNVTSANNISVLVNGNSVSNFNYDMITKRISFSANLIFGANIIQISGTNTVGTDSRTTTIVYQPLETMPMPIVEFVVPNVSPFTSPANNITLKATVLNVTSSSYIKVYVNGQVYNNFAYNSTTKEVSFNVNLINGNNLFKVLGTNSVGSDEAEQIVVHKLVQNPLPPIVNITHPNSNPHVTNSNTQLINAQIQNVDNINGVTAKFNGVNVTDFTFDHITDKFTYNAELLVGANIIEITGTNNVGTASKSSTIIYNIPESSCDNPIIDLIQPKAQTKINIGGNLNAPVNINTTNNKGAITAKITNANSIDFKIDGQSVPGYNYNAGTGAFESFLHLKEGANTYQIIAINECGTTVQNITYIYTPEEMPCDNPVIHFVSPENSPYNYNGVSPLSVSANVLGVNNATQIDCKLNNKPLKKLFDPNTGMLTANLILVEGNNSFEIIATNDCGTVTQTMVINYTKPLARPTVKITVPAPLPYTTDNGNNINVKAKVTNVANASGISILLEGQPFTNYNFNVNTQEVSFNLTLPIGSHDVIVKATNTAGSAQDMGEIIVEEKEAACIPPVIKVTQPQGVSGASISINTENSKGAILATIENATNVVFKINGQVSPGFNFNPSNGQFESMLNLKEGSNTYELSVSNACGQDKKIVTYNYTPAPPPCDAPTVTILTPNVSPVEHKVNAPITVTARVTGVADKSQIFSKFNNNYLNQTYNASTQMLTLTLTSFVDGNNQLNIMAKNECGSDSKTIVVNFSVVNPNDGWTRPNDNNNNSNEVHDPNAVDSAATVDPNNPNSGGGFGEGGNQTFDPNSGNGTGGSGGGTGGKPNIGGNGNNGGGNSNGNNGHGNNADGVDSSNPGQGGGGPNGQEDASGNVDDENGNNGGGNPGTTNMGTTNNGQNQAQNSQMIKLNNDYNAAMQKGNSFNQARNYNAAYAEYQKASVLKPNEALPKQKMAEVQQKIQQEQQQKAIDDNYNDQIKKGDLYFKAGNFSTAKTFYTKALGYKPNEAYPKQKINEINAKMSQIQQQQKPVINKPVNNKKPTNSTKPTNTSSPTKTNTPVKQTPTNTGGQKTNTPEKTTPEKKITPTIKPKQTVSPTKLPGRGGN